MEVVAPTMSLGRVGSLVKTRLFVHFLLLLIFLCCVHSQTIENTSNNIKSGVELRVQKGNVVVDNGIFQVTFSSPEGSISGIKYNGLDNVLDVKVGEPGYWDVVWHEPGESAIFDRMHGTEFKVITQTQEQVEISFTKKWDMSRKDPSVPLNVDKRFIIRRGVSGIYMYGVLERLKGWPDVNMDQTRIVFKLKPSKFNYMAISDKRQRYMPSTADRDIKSGRAQPLAYKEAVLLKNPRDPSMKGEVDDKYMYSLEDKDNQLHGFISGDPPVGFWMITPSDEFRCGGPIKQDLSSHAGPIVLSMFTSTHYAGLDMNTKYGSEEPWKKVFGPVFVYLNSVPRDNKNAIHDLWTDAKRQMLEEVQNWPYEFVNSEDYPLSNQRGTVRGQLLVKDSYISKQDIFAKSAFVGLAPPGEAGSWQTGTKGYQFWTQADANGGFTIKNVREGSYSLFAWVPGFIGDYKYENDVIITPGNEINLGAIVYEPPRRGPMLWEIGVPDRTAAEFYIPDPYPNLVNKLYLNLPEDKFRQYGLWDSYTDLYPDGDLVYKIGESDYRKDWFCAQVTRNTGNNTRKATTWQIVFNLGDVNQAATYTLRLALASITLTDLQVRINEANSKPLFRTGLIGKDNSIVRHGIHGLYRLFNVDVSGKSLRVGENTLYLSQNLRQSVIQQGIMYDYIRLEGPSTA